MRAVSKKRAAQMRVYFKLRRDYLEANPTCVYPEGCGQAATEVHHRKGRIGALLLDVEHWAGLCHDHHAYVTGNPTLAYTLGISERRVGA